MERSQVSMDWKKIKAEYIAGGTSSTVTDAKPNYLQNTIFGGDVVYNKNQEYPSHFILRL